MNFHCDSHCRQHQHRHRHQHRARPRQNRLSQHDQQPPQSTEAKRKVQAISRSAVGNYFDAHKVWENFFNLGSGIRLIIIIILII